MRNVTILLAVLAVLALSAAPVHALSYWTNDDTNNNYWNTTDNWEVGTDYGRPPDEWDSAWMKGDACEVLADGICKRLKLGYEGEAGSLTLTNGFLDLDYKSTVEQSAIGYQGGLTYSTFTQTGGTLYLGTHLAIGQSWEAGKYGYGRYTISGGELDGREGKSDVRLGYTKDDGGTDTGTQANTAGEFIIVGGGDNGPSNIQIGDDFYPQSGSTLKFVFDGDDDPIEKLRVNDRFLTTCNLVVTDPTGTTPVGEYEIVEYGTDATTFDNVSLPSGWTLISMDDDRDNDGKKEVWVRVPEPATLALLGLGGIGVLLRRRKS